MNLTELFEDICEELDTQGAFNGVEVIEAYCESEYNKREDARLDELSDEETENYINNYTIARFDFDFDSNNWHDFDAPDYVRTEFDFHRFEHDFRNYLISKGVPEDCIPNNMFLHGFGGDIEFYKGVK